MADVVLRLMFWKPRGKLFYLACRRTNAFTIKEIHKVSHLMQEKNDMMEFPRLKFTHTTWKAL